MTNFYSDTIRSDARFRSTARCTDLALLEPGFRSKVIELLKESPLPLMVFETYRSEERQIALFEQRATRLRTVGVHHYGLACDLVKSVAGEPTWKGDFSFLGDLAGKFGLVWGGDWGEPAKVHTFVDLDHVQAVTLAQQPALFAGTWYP